MVLNLIDYSDFEKFKSELLQEIKSLGEKKSKQLTVKMRPDIEYRLQVF